MELSAKKELGFDVQEKKKSLLILEKGSRRLFEGGTEKIFESI